MMRSKYYQTPLEGVLALELVIIPDRQDGGTYATLRNGAWPRPKRRCWN
jgi:hypothetical protein